MATQCRITHGQWAQSATHNRLSDLSLRAYVAIDRAKVSVTHVQAQSQAARSHPKPEHIIRKLVERWAGSSPHLDTRPRISQPKPQNGRRATDRCVWPPSTLAVRSGHNTGSRASFYWSKRDVNGYHLFLVLFAAVLVEDGHVLQETGREGKCERTR